MTWAFVGNLGGTGNGVSSTTVSFATSGSSAPVGSVVIARVASDNINTTDGDFSEVVSVQDSTGGNAWAKIAEFTNGQAGAAAGCTVSVWMAHVGTEIPSGATIQATFSSAVTAKAITADRFSIAAGNFPQLAGPVQTLADDAAAPGEMTISGLPSREYLFIRALAGETTLLSFEESPDWIDLKSFDYDGGPAAASMGVAGEYEIATGTGITSAPIEDTATEWASVLFALVEVLPTSTLFFGAGP